MINNAPIRDIFKYLRLFRLYLGPKIYIVFGLTLFSALADSFGILLFLPLLEYLSENSLNEGGSINQNYGELGQFMISFVNILGFENDIWALSIIILCIFLLKAFFMYSSYALSAKYRGQFLEAIKNKSFELIGSSSYSHFIKKDVGYYTNIVNEQANNAVYSFYQTTLFFAQSVNVLFYSIIGIFLSIQIGLTVLIFGLLFVILIKGISLYIRKLSRNLAKESGKLSNLIIESLNSYKYLKSTGTFSTFEKKVSAYVKGVANNQVRSAQASAIAISIRDPIALLIIFSIIYIQVNIVGGSISSIVVSLILFYRAFNFFIGAQGSWHSVLAHIGSFELVDNEINLLKKNIDQSNFKNNKPRFCNIEFKNVNFYHSNAKNIALDSISLKIQQNKTSALVGKSGSGKTTLADLIAMLYMPTSGKIFIDGIDSNDINALYWRKQIGYVSQDSAIFNDTISNNISLWDDSMSNIDTLIRIKSAAKAAYLDDFIESLPDSYNTKVGDKGVRLSGGQKQRLFIARELYKKPLLLILDEATSALDIESERNVQRSIEELSGYMTILIIAHRITTIKNADNIYVIDRGQLIESGTYEDLLSKDSSYFSELARNKLIQ